jgi:hypothetical protein
MNAGTPSSEQRGRDSSGSRIFPGMFPRIFLIVLITVLVTAGATLWITRVYLFPEEFRPVHLSAREEQALNLKLERLDSVTVAHRQRNQDRSGEPRRRNESGVLVPERYSEAVADRRITLTERELNALLAKNTDLARKLAIDLSDHLISAKLLVPLDEDLPVLGGRTLKVKAGLALTYRNNRPVVVLKGISLMGVPLPGAWLGGLKNIDLVEAYGKDAGFWKSFADGVSNISVSEGKLQIELKE